MRSNNQVATKRINLGEANIPPEVRRELYRGLVDTTAWFMAEGWGVPRSEAAEAGPTTYSYRLTAEEDAYLVFVEVLRHGRKDYFARGVNLPATSEVNTLILELSPGRLLMPTMRQWETEALRRGLNKLHCPGLVDYVVVGPGVTGEAFNIIDTASERADVPFCGATKRRMKMRLQRRLAYLRRLDIGSSIGLKKIAQALALYDLEHYGYDNPKTLASGDLARLGGDVVYLSSQIGEALNSGGVSTRFFPEVKTINTALLLEHHFLSSVINHGKIIGAPVMKWVYHGLRNYEAPGTLLKSFEEDFAGLGWLHVKAIEAKEYSNEYQ